MRRSAPAVRSLSAAGSSSAAETMSFAPKYRGGGRGRWQRSFSDQRNNAGRGRYTADESCAETGEDANVMFREGARADPRIQIGTQPPPVNGGKPYNQSFRPPSPYNNSQQYQQNEYRPTFRSGRPYNPNQSFRFRQPSPPYDHNPQFAPPQQYNQNPRLYRPRPSIQNQQFQQQPLPYPNQPFYQPLPYHQHATVGRPQLSQPRPPQSLNYRSWEFAGTKLPTSCKQFVVLSYNILADYLALNHRSKLYYHIPRYMLDWEWRKRNIIFELGLWSADIMCFQEVDRFQDLEEELKLRGYNGTWKMRTGDPVDGCAIFWRTSRFKLLHEEFIEFNKLGLRDNVAQICVFELTSEDSSETAGKKALSSAGSDKIVVCNIHVLYNPKRGDIKIGQIRVLLDTAHVVSKGWDDAPVILCGDFNCTPESPLYNFITEQKLNLSGVDKDKVSGQASAEIRGSRLYIRNNGELPAEKSFQDVPSVDKLGEHKSSCPDVKDNLTEDELSQESSCSNAQLQDVCQHVQPNHEATSDPQNALGVTSDEIPSTSQVSGYKSETCSALLDGGGFPEDLAIINKDEQKYSDNRSDLSEESMEFGVAAIEPNASNLSPYMTSVDLSSNKIADNKDSSAEPVDEKLKLLSLDELDEQTVKEGGSLHEDDTALSTALHDGEDSVPVDSSSGLEIEPVEEGRFAYNPSVWTPTDIATATGSEDCLVLEHKLKLKSTYTEVEDSSRTRDSNGEPLVTSYNSRFMGTVDYIWRSGGLQTVRVLAPIPKQAMQWTQGFPTKKWGSDHIALVSELALAVVSDQEAGVHDVES